MCGDIMRINDNKRLDTLIAAKKKSAEKYEKFGIEMRVAGYTRFADALFEIANDELNHVESLEYIKLIS